MAVNRENGHHDVFPAMVSNEFVYLYKSSSFV